MNENPQILKSIILYGSPVKLTKAHKPVHSSGGFEQPEYFVRMDTFNGDVSLALDKASPMPGELVLNTAPYPYEHTNT